MSLPRTWGGSCALVALSDHSFYMTEVNDHPTQYSRTRRDTDAINTQFNWLGLAPNPVLHQYRIWGCWQRLSHSFFPWIGVGEIRTHVEINRYALMRLINDTKNISSGRAVEVNAIQLMTMQNRLVLDQLTAASGGVYKMIGDTCCMFTPDNAGDGGTIYKVLQDLTDLQTYVPEYTSGATSSGFSIWSWFASGTWYVQLHRALIILVAMLLLICCVISCIFPFSSNCYFLQTTSFTEPYSFPVLSKDSYVASEVTDDFDGL